MAPRDRLLHDCVRIPYSGAAAILRCALLVRRLIADLAVADLANLMFYLPRAPKRIALAKLVQIDRWPIETVFEQAQGRGWPGSILGAVPGRMAPQYQPVDGRALAYLSVVRTGAAGRGGPDEPHRRAAATYGACVRTPAVGAGQPEVIAAALYPARVDLAPPYQQRASRIHRCGRAATHAGGRIGGCDKISEVTLPNCSWYS